MGHEFSLLTAWGHGEMVCAGGIVDLHITEPRGFGLSQIIIKTPVRKTRHNYFFPACFPYLACSLKHIFGIISVRYHFHFWKV